MCIYSENHPIKIGSTGLQLIHNDNIYNETEIYVQFEWNGTNVIRANFVLVNKQSLRPGYKIHSAFFCPDMNRFEVHISRHSTFTELIYSISRQNLAGLNFPTGVDRNMCIRLTENSLESKHHPCEIIEVVDGDPDDKDGSILIGTL